ncbi:MAG: hypothetical protein A2234_03550 [Elusimicrobia bacterium RIFOXYA2_FULL_58_8]|nr:MAG: hypothetical protein A2285_05225 [Elusimicrobia bacterium RIFOXYA12_FULL_57_11]OGS17195.1 MAG: hypothetical protein A2234_03550 [Elusimicrobia bacterium RIFOXYA2_FULL_58_8]
MKALFALVLIALPVGAQAMGMHGKMCGCAGGGAHAAVALYALLAALGYWVLQHAGKETQAYVKRTGVLVGMTLVIVSLLGVLCGAAKHAKSGMRQACKCQMGAIMAENGYEERVVVGGKKSGEPMQINVKVTKKTE